MPTVNILDAFGYKWGQTGTAEPITDDQWKLGWSFIGATPPSVEQFNKWGQVFDEKSNYLYAQMKAVFDAAGEVPDPADLNSLRDAMRALVGAGRLINIQTLLTSGTFTRSAGATSGIVHILGGGAGGSGSSTTAAGQVSVGSGGGGGAYGQHYFDGNLPASQIFTIGAGGAGGAIGAAGGAGGTTIFGSLNAPGAIATSPSVAGAPPVLIGGGPGGVTGTGCNVMNSPGFGGKYALAVGTGGFVSGAGGDTPFGGGAAPNVTGAANGLPSSVRGGGGAGGSNGVSSSGQTGGAGGAGMIIVIELS